MPLSTPISLKTHTTHSPLPSDQTPPPSSKVKAATQAAPVDVFYDVPLDSPKRSTQKPSAIPATKHLPLSVDDTNVVLPQYFGLTRLEKPCALGATLQTAINRKDKSLKGVPESALQVMEAICKTNSEPMYTSARRFVLHKRKGFPPTMEALSPKDALQELAQGNHIKVTLARVLPWVEPGKKNLVVTRALPDWTYRLETFESLTNWWKSMGWAYQLGTLPGTHSSLK